MGKALGIRNSGVSKGLVFWLDVGTDGTGISDLTVGDQTAEYLIRAGEGGALSGWDCHLAGAPAGSSVILDILKNGVSVFTTKITVLAGQVSASGSGFNGTVTVAPGDLVRGKVIQVGSTTPGKTAQINLYII